MKAQVFEQQNLSGLEFLDHLLGFPSDTIGRKSDVAVSTLGLVEQDAQMFRDRTQAHLRIRLTLGAAEMRSQDHVSAMLQCVIDRRKGLDDTGIVGDAAVLIEGNVEVDANEDAFVL